MFVFEIQDSSGLIAKIVRTIITPEYPWRNSTVKLKEYKCFTLCLDSRRSNKT